MNDLRERLATITPGTGRPYERSELQTERNEVLDDRQVLGHGAQGGWVRVRPAGERPQAEVIVGTEIGEETAVEF